MPGLRSQHKNETPYMPLLIITKVLSIRLISTYLLFLLLFQRWRDPTSSIEDAADIQIGS
jgi:hypothetical protein